MRRMKRKQIYIESERDRSLRDVSCCQGESESASAREGINRVLAEAPLTRAAWQTELTHIDSLIKKGPLKGRRNWKREDLYER